MASFILTWHLYSAIDLTGKSKYHVNYKAGDEVEWPCNSEQIKQAVIGDSVYIMVRDIPHDAGLPNGLFMKGIVVQAAYSGADWDNPEQQSTFIRFKVESVRENCEQGCIPQVLLQVACPEQNWRSIQSGEVIQNQYQARLDEFWKQGESQHSLALYLQWLKQEKFSKDGWYKGYAQACELAQEIKQTNTLSEKALEKLWAKVANGVASVGRGFMYKREFQASHQFLKQITFDILNNPTKECYQSVLHQWKNEAGFERVLWAVIRRVFAVADPVHLTSIVGDSYLDKLFPLLREHFQIDLKRTNLWLDDNAQLIEKTAPYLPQEIDVITRNILLWYLYEFSVPALQGKKQNGAENHPQQLAENTPQYQDDDNMPSMGLNQILYGPPGTGKTYHTVKLAVDAAEPTFQPEGEGEAQKRKSYKQKYDDLMREGRIRFVTFHQSYGYEEFVEGLKASTDDDGNISYDVEKGVFRKIVDEALKYQQKRQESKAYSFDNAWQVFTEKLAVSKVIEVPMVKATFTVHDFNENRIFFEKQGGNRDQALSIKTLREIFDGVREYKEGLGVYYRPLADHLKSLSQPVTLAAQERKNFVLIIDEINRGNISQIFGELITLIEPSKRAGQNESLQVVLPYSGKPFSVPDNLYLIGTMNTADRSLALMDTALRRRFDFVEMMPDYNKLADDTGAPYRILQGENELDLSELLTRLNQRITALYDREHTLGHAFFMPVIERIIENDHQAAIQELALCFKNKIIPLLAEYFFEDWEKIRLVLADNQKELRELPTLIEKQGDNIHDLFGDSDDLDAFEEHIANYQLAPDISKQLENALTYIRMYDIRA